MDRTVILINPQNQGNPILSSPILSSNFSDSKRKQTDDGSIEVEDQWSQEKLQSKKARVNGKKANIFSSSLID
jgi:hypothetical protein